LTTSTCGEIGTRKIHSRSSSSRRRKGRFGAKRKGGPFTGEETTRKKSKSERVNKRTTQGERKEKPFNRLVWGGAIKDPRTEKERLALRRGS